MRVGDDPNQYANTACEIAVDMTDINAGQEIAINCNLKGRYISVTLNNGGDALALCEVKATYGTCNEGNQSHSLAFFPDIANS